MMNIRNAEPRDAAGIAAVVHSIKDLDAIAGDSIGATTDKIRENLNGVNSASSSAVLVAESEDGSILAYCAVHWVPLLFLPGGEAYVTELFVREHDSGKGIGSQLLDEVVALATRQGCSRISLLNGRLGQSYRRQFYAKRGWVERSEMANFILPLKPVPAAEP